MSGAVVAIIAAQAAAARQSLMERFRISDATRPERAQSLTSLGITRTSALDELIRKGAIREARPGLFYLDEAAVAALSKAHPTRALKIFLLVLAAIILLTLGITFLEP